MSRQREAWPAGAWSSGSSYGPRPATGDHHISGPGGVRGVAGGRGDDAHGALGTAVPAGHGGAEAFGHGAVEIPADQARTTFVPGPPVDPARPAAVRSPASPRRGRHAGARRKARPRDPSLPARLAWALVRVALGLIFLWTFADRLVGLDRPVAASHAWLNGGSPTRGYLLTAEGPFAELFHAMAGRPYADWLFMVGMAGLGVALVLGIGLRVAAVLGSALLMLIYLAGLPLEAHPFIDQHVVYALVLIALALSRAGDTAGLGAWWSRTRLVRAVPVLR